MASDVAQSDPPVRPVTGKQGENFWLQVELFSGSYGGRYGMDGMDSVDVL